MATAKKKRKPGTPSPAQLRARRKFAAMAKARAKAARAAKRAAGIKSKKRPVARKRNAAGYIDAQGRFRPIRSGTTPSGKPAKKAYSPKKVGEKRAYATTAKAKGRRASKAASSTSSDVLRRSMKARALRVNPRPAHKVSQIKKDLIYAIMNATGGAYRYSQLKTYSIARLEALLKKVKNPSGGLSRAKAQHKEFFGHKSERTRTVYVPKGSKVKGALSAMGKLHKIKVRGRTAFDFSQGNIFLARDGRNRMHIAGKGYRIAAKGKRRNPDGFEDLGVIESIEYVATKSHLDGEPTIYVHKMGEEGGAKPHLLINDEGLALIDGGDYTITERGIEN